MFCPKCGANIPDGAKFCNSCGQEIGASAAPQPSAGASVSLPGLSLKLAPAQIGALIAAIVAIIFSLMPWFECSSSLLGSSYVADGIGQLGSMFAGESHSSSVLDSSYSVFGFLGISDILMQPLGSGSAPLIIAIFLGWLLSLILLVVGGVSMVLSTKLPKGFLMAGAIVLAIVAFLWFFWMNGYLVQTGYAAGPATNALICGIACVAVIACSMAARKTPSNV